MPKILSQAGTSLADVYDVAGSIAGVDFLDSNDVQLTHEMGGEIHSERLLGHTITVSSGAVASGANWDVDFETIPDCWNRIMGVYVTASVASEVEHCNVNLRPRATLANSFPIWWWDGFADGEGDLRIMQAGSTATRINLIPRPAAQPFQYIMGRTGLEKQLPFLTFSGQAQTGAGVTCLATIYLARPDTVEPAAGDPSSHGLPIPSW